MDACSEPDDAAAVTWLVPGMDEPRVVRAVTARLLDLPGVQWVQADAATTRLTVGGRVRPGEVRRALQELGHDPDRGTQPPT
jgi:hypothetical protein